MSYKKSFSLLELTIIMVVIGILSTLSVRQYNTSREKALAREAQANLRLIVAAEKIYRMEYSTYYYGTDITQINSNLKLYLSATNWTWAITGLDPNFIASADRFSGPYSNCIYQITQAGGDPTSTNCP